MQIGFINFNTDEKKRVAKLMQLLQESEAIEELGIGRVRDHFSNTLFRPKGDCPWRTDAAA